MLVPKKVKYRKWHRLRKNPNVPMVETRGTNLSFGSFGLKGIGMARITSNQIESARKIISRFAGKSGKMWIRVFPDMPYTAKAAEVPMGSGKGEVQGYCMEIKPGRVLFEVDGIPEAEAREALRKAGTKLPVKTKIVAR